MRRGQLLLFTAVTLFITAVYFLYRMQTAVPPDRIMRGVTVHGVAVGWMTAEEAEAALADKFNPGADNKTVTFEGSSVYTFADFGFRLNFSAAINEAMRAGRGSAANRFAAALPWTKPPEISTPPSYTFDKEETRRIISKIADEKSYGAVDASFALKNGKIVTTPGADGRRLDEDKAFAAVEEILKRQQNGTVKPEYISVSPAHPTEDFAFEPALLGRFETKFTGAPSDPRLGNIKVASGRINNQVLFPGEVFSAGAKVGSGTPDNGYSRAVVLVNGKPVEDWGGGVCQVVTTLYNAVLYAELDVLERHNHSAKVSYADYGFDATVAGDYFDLKFKNSTPRPLLIVSHADGGKLTVEIYGSENRPRNRRVEFNPKLIETIPPEPEKVTYDETVPAGEIWVNAPAQNGYKYELYKNVYVNGRLAETVRVNTSVYKPIRGEVSRREHV